jgi:hypothetical protein
LTKGASQFLLPTLSLCSFLPFFGFNFKIVGHSPTQVPKRRLHDIPLPQNLDAAVWRCAAEAQVGLLASPRVRGTEHVDQRQCRADIATTNYPVRRSGYFFGTATDRNCHQLVEETESTPKRVVRPLQQEAAYKALALPGLRAQASESSRDLSVG